MGTGSELAGFLWGLVAQYATLATGGIVIALIAGVEHFLNKTISWSWYFGLTIILFFVAFFLMWRGQNDEIVKLNAEVDPPISVSFEWQNNNHFLSFDGSAFWIRVDAYNNSARNISCIVEINRIEKIGDSTPLYSGHLQLSWEGGLYEYRDNIERTLAPRDYQTFNIALVQNRSDELTFQNPNLVKKLRPGSYEFTIRAPYPPCISNPAKIELEYSGGQKARFIDPPGFALSRVQ